MNRPQQAFSPIRDQRGEPHVRRFDEQRWVIDNIIRANGIDWDQPRSLYIHGPCGIEANADFAGIRERVKKMADIGPASRRRATAAKAGPISAIFFTRSRMPAKSALASIPQGPWI